MTVVMHCPACEWKYEVPPVNPQADNPAALAGVFGYGVFQATAHAQRIDKTERALDAHTKTHTVLEWIGAINRQKKRADDLVHAVKECDQYDLLQCQSKESTEGCSCVTCNLKRLAGIPL